MNIRDREIGPGHRPYLIAEMSGNHNQSLERAAAHDESNFSTPFDGNAVDFFDSLRQHSVSSI